MNKKIGFVGLGTVGLPMAINLSKAGFEVVGYNVFDGSRKRAKAAGIIVAVTLRKVTKQAGDAVVSMIRDCGQNVEILLGENGLLSVDPKGLTIIVTSALDPDSMNALSQQVEAAADVKLIAAAVSGGATGAQTGTLSITTSGPGDRVNAARPHFDAVSSNIFYYGTNPGSSQAAKLVNNMVLDVVMNGIAEDLKFGEHHNLPRGALLNLFKANTGDNWVARNRDSVPKWTEDTTLAVLLKDLRATYLKNLKHGIAMPFGALSSTILFGSWG